MRPTPPYSEVVALTAPFIARRDQVSSPSVAPLAAAIRATPRSHLVTICRPATSSTLLGRSGVEVIPKNLICLLLAIAVLSSSQTNSILKASHSQQSAPVFTDFLSSRQPALPSEKFEPISEALIVCCLSASIQRLRKSTASCSSRLAARQSRIPFSVA